jgi:hypothetical protein
MVRASEGMRVLGMALLLLACADCAPMDHNDGLLGMKNPFANVVHNGVDIKDHILASGKDLLAQATHTGKDLLDHANQLLNTNADMTKINHMLLAAKDQMDAMLQQKSWNLLHFAHADTNVYGAIICIVASVISNCGCNLQKHAHNVNEKKPEAERVSYMYSWIWWLGFFGTIGGAIGDFVALGLASQSLVAALGGATTLTANLYIAHKFNHDPVYWTDVVGVGIIICGAVTFALTSTRSETYSSAELLHMFTAPSFLVYIGTQLLVVVVLMATIATSEVYRWRVQATQKVLTPVLAKLSEVEELRSGKVRVLKERVALLEREIAKKTGIAMRPPPEEEAPIKPFAFNPNATDHWSDQYVYASCSGVIGAMSLIFAGCTSKMIGRLIRGYYDEWLRPQPYLLLVCMTLSMAVQTHMLNVAMMKGDTMSVYPVFQSFWITFGVIGGVVYYQLGTINVTPVAIMMVGMCFLVQHGKQVRLEAARTKGACDDRDDGRHAPTPCGGGGGGGGGSSASVAPLGSPGGSEGEDGVYADSEA